MLTAAFIAALIDIDHFLFAHGRSLHNVFVTVLLPAILFYAAYHYEKGQEQIKLQSFVILLFVMLNGHIIADAFAGSITPFYPLSTFSFSIPAWRVPFFVNPEIWSLVESKGVVITIYAAIIGLAYFTEEILYFFEKKHESLEEAFEDSLGI